jgi:hypothetical protein
MSVSRIRCTLELKGKGSVELALYRHLAPITVDALVEAMPLVSRVTLFPKTVCILTGIRTGVEKKRYECTRGDVSFLAASGLLCFALGNTRSDRPLNPVGRLEKGTELLEKAAPGDVIEIRKSQDTADQT